MTTFKLIIFMNCLKEEIQIVFTKFMCQEFDIFVSEVTIRIGSFPVQTPLGARLGLGTQPPYEAPGDFQVEIR